MGTIALIPPTDTDIQIVCLNTDKTRPAGRSKGAYDIYFDLSPTPPAVWRSIFNAEWKGMNPGAPQMWGRVGVNNKFLVLQSTLSEIAGKYLPLLRKAVAAANVSFARYTQNAAAAQEDRENVWKEERARVDRVAGSLLFVD